MDSVLRDFDLLFVHIENTFITSRSREEHLVHLQTLWKCTSLHRLWMERTEKYCSMLIYCMNKSELRHVRLHYVETLNLGCVDEILSISCKGLQYTFALFNPPSINSCYYVRSFNLHFKAKGICCLFSKRLGSLLDTQYSLLDVPELWQTSSSCELWRKSSHRYTIALKKASHKLNKRFLLHLWHLACQWTAQ